jgi:hypothetical protein
VEVHPIRDSYWVIPNKLLAGEYPGARDEEEAQGKLRWLLEKGVTAWLDLTEDGKEGLPAYAGLLNQQAFILNKAVSHTRMAIQDFSTPPVEHMQHILDQLDTLIEEGQVVYLHCYGGIGRTGMAVGCYLVRHGWQPEAALRQIEEWRREIPSGWRSSPETQEQVEFVLDWVREKARSESQG